MDGTVHIAAATTIIRFERHLNHRIGKVWAALTQPDQLHQWLAFPAEIEPRVGARVHLVPGQLTVDSTVTALDPPHLDRYTRTLGRPGGEPAAAQGGRRARPARQFRPSRARRVADTIMRVLVRAGLVPSTYLLTTTGRKTGRPLTHPAAVVEQDGRRWLVAPYGTVSWVHNARAAGRVTLARRGDRHHYAVREVPAAEAGPVLKRYVGVATATRPYFGADKDAPVEDFVAEADRHPVFELLPIHADRPTVTVDADGADGQVT